MAMKGLRGAYSSVVFGVSVQADPKVQAPGADHGCAG